VQEATVDRKKTGKKPPSESGRAAIRLAQLVVERTGKGTTNTMTPGQGYLLRKRNTS